MKKKKTHYANAFQEVFEAPFFQDDLLGKRLPFKPKSAGIKGGIKLILDTHEHTNFVKDYRKGEKNKLVFLALVALYCTLNIQISCFHT